jgi:hypothetical protein
MRAGIWSWNSFADLVFAEFRLHSCAAQVVNGLRLFLMTVQLPEVGELRRYISFEAPGETLRERNLSFEKPSLRCHFWTLNASAFGP